MRANYAIVAIQRPAEFYTHRMDPDGVGTYSCLDCKKRASFDSAYMSPYNKMVDGYVRDPPGFNQEWLWMMCLTRHESSRKVEDKEEQRAENAVEG